MRQAYALLGLCFLIVGFGAYVIIKEAKGHYVPFSAPAREVPPLGQSQTNMSILSLTSNAFKEGGSMPSRYTCDGKGLSPSFTIEGVPEGTKSLALVGVDPDIPQAAKTALGADAFVHLVAYDIPSGTRMIGEGDMAGTFGLNSSNKAAFAPLCPPPQYEPKEHRYIFTLYAIDRELSFRSAPQYAELMQAMEGAVLASSTLMGKYERK